MVFAHRHLHRRSTLRVQQLDMLLHLAETGSIGLTAERLCLTQSAVAKSLKEMEISFGTSLFQRTARGLQITEFGKLVENYAGRVIVGLESILADIQRQQCGS